MNERDALPRELRLEINRLCLEFERAWRAGQVPQIEDLAARLPDHAHVAAYCELIAQEVDLRWEAGQSAERDEYYQRFPQHTGAVKAAFSLLEHRRPQAGQWADTESLLADAASDTNRDQGPAPPPRDAPPLPQRLGRFEIQQRLGRGAFGEVYLAHDPQLDRRVALKVPRQEQFSSPEELDAFVQEARTAAGLTHPGIVTIHDVVQDGGLLFIVQEHVDGQDLGKYLKAQASSLPAEQAADLLMSITEAVAFAHQKGFVHRDLKPANILLDADQRPRVADFGLAVHETVQRRRKGERSGTPAYMSPEQVRGETHRLDGRSDIWSLGVILYELLTGRHPFQGRTRDELFDEIKHRDPRPPRQSHQQVPPELERICLKCLSKRVTDRYPSGRDLVDDLRQWSTPATSLRPPASVKIVPKGLRSFDEKDAYFFLGLLPGPRDRDGLPESIRFWKTRLEEPDGDRTFAVGLIYGPSGCGKSSLVKAGLLPRLASHVLPIYVEATPADTEVRLLKGLRKACPAIPQGTSLPEVCDSLREGIWLPPGRKVVLVLDQFEQWLHTHRAEQDTQLVTALRHCDGARLQAVVMVRDDFWMAVTRFFAETDVRLVEGHNTTAVDLFDLLHARQVLAEFGKAYGRLPDNLSEVTPEQERFLDASVQGLAREGKVISVRLSLFADMVKGKPWTPATLHEVGGAEGVGVNFLEETFSASSAPVQHRFHQQGARAVLRKLLPQQGSDIKGNMQPRQALVDAAMEASEHYRRTDSFDDLLRLLDGELRLITPTDPEGIESAEGSPVSANPEGAYYQLTHDYLVPSLRDWLTRKQRETRRGRAELRLEERAANWSAKPENRYLPSLWEYLNISALTNARHWTDSQRTMMARATRFHGFRSALGAAALVALLAIGMVVRTNVARQQETTRIRGLVGELTNAEPAQVPGIAGRLAENPDVAATFLASLLSTDGVTPDDKRARLHAQMATVARDPSLVEPLVEELLTGKVTYVMPIRQQLRPSAARLTEIFRSLLRDEKAEPKRRFHAALALADYIPESEANAWTDQDLKFVAEQLVSSNAEFQPLLREALRPIREKLLPDLERIFGNAQATDAQRVGAANAFADYAASDVAKLSRPLAAATPEQYSVLYPLVEASPSPAAIEDLGKMAATLPPDELGSVERIPFGQRRANAAVTLLRLGQREKVFSVFDMTDDPEALTQFIFRCRPRGVGVDALLDCLRTVSSAAKDRYPTNTRYALLLALGEFTLAELPEARRDALLTQLADWYAHDPSSGVHGAAGWLLRQWGQADVVAKVDQTPVPYSPDREWFTLAITVTPTPPPKPKEKPAAESSGTESAPEKAADTGQGKGEKGSPPDQPQEVTSAGVKGKAEAPAQSLPPKTFYYTFIVFPAGEYAIGSPADEPERTPQEGREQRHRVILTRPFAVLDREVTMEELIAFSPPYAGFMQQLQAQRSDAGFGADWYDSVGFCRWLGEQLGLAESDQPYADPKLLDKEKYPREPNPLANWAPRDWPVDLKRPGFRLPTEAEWEVAARGGARTAYGYGSEVSLAGRFGWFQENSGRHGHPPKELRPSARGLFDLHGNLFEWTHDWYEDFGLDAVTDPAGPQRGSLRVYRGGSWGFGAARCRSALRITVVPADRTGNGGFRLALSPSGVQPEADKVREQGAEPAGVGTEERSGAATTVP